MSRQFPARWLVGLLAAAGAASSGVQPAARPTVMADATPGANAASAPSATRATLRVGMWTLWHDRELVLMPAGAAHKITLRSCASCATLTFTQPVRVNAEEDAVTLTAAGRTGHVERLSITGAVTLTAHGETVTLRNPVTITARSGVLVIVITMPAESYVERVVESESGPSDGAESLKALAIVVRSFALHQAHGHADYDLCDSTHCQLLHWSESSTRKSAAHAATLATSGETLWFRGQRALAYFGKDCGGRTASPDEVWPRGRPVPYLPSKPDRYCTTDGGREWASEITRAELTAALSAHGLAAPGWRNLTVAQRGESGRAVTLRLDGAEINAEEFRLAVGESLGWNRIPSTWFEVSREGDRFEFHGRGWGHGVGLCQKGAAIMAAQGRSALQILDEYFPGTQIADEATGQTWKSFAGSGFVLESLAANDAAYLPDLNRARAEASERSGLNGAAPLTVRAFVSTPAFREATLAPGWVAAFTEGNWIGSQPLHTLAARRLLESTMRHEFLHALVEEQAGPRAPLWLREGLVEMWSEAGGTASPSHAGTSTLAPALTPEAVNAALAHTSTETESEAAHRAAAWYAAQLMTRFGHLQVLEWLRSGLPAGAVASLGQR